MKNKPYRILILLIFLLTFPFLLISDTSASSIEDTSLQDVINAGKIVVGIEPHVPPFEQRNPVTDEIEGFDPDIMQYIADDIGVSIEWVDVSWTDIFPGLQNGDYDCIISTVSITEQRETVMDFSRWYYRSALTIMVNDDNPAGIDNFDDINSTDVKVGVQDFISEWYFDNEGIIAEKIAFANITLAVEALMNGIVDVIFGGFTELMDIKEKHSEPLYIIDVFLRDVLGIPVQTGFDTLRLRINTILDELLGENLIHSEPNSYYTASHEEWFDVKPNLNFKGEVTYYSIYASCSENGNITPEGETSVKEGDDIFFNFLSNDGLLVDNVIIDGTSIGNPSNFTFNDVDSDHTIEVNFTENREGSSFDIPGYSMITFMIISSTAVSIVSVKIQKRKMK